jgi:hypothetical protein
MNIDRLFGSVLPVLAVIGCQVADEHDLGEGRAYIGTTGTIPADATCTHIVATRLADFVVSEYKGALSGGVFSVQAGESRVTATAYPPPCSAEPAQPPWIADEQITTFTDGANTLMLRFHANTQVAIDPTFDDINPLHVTVRPGSPIRTGRNGEDAAGPNYSLDGWEIKRIALPPEAPSETVLFSTEGKGALAFSPRGLAAMPDGTFAVQLSAPAEPLRQFSATGDFLEFWSVIYPAGATPFDNTDGLEAIDATHLSAPGSSTHRSTVTPAARAATRPASRSSSSSPRRAAATSSTSPTSCSCPTCPAGSSTSRFRSASRRSAPTSPSPRFPTTGRRPGWPWSMPAVR